jgi:hypothetical protein
MVKKRWEDLTDSQRVALLFLGLLQFALLATALWDIRQWRAEDINGSKVFWTLAAFINFVGPLAYFAFGRKNVGEPGLLPGL